MSKEFKRILSEEYYMFLAKKKKKTNPNNGISDIAAKTNQSGQVDSLCTQSCKWFGVTIQLL